MLHICPLSTLQETAKEVGAKYLITLVSDGTIVERPDSIEEANHLFLGFNDIDTEIDGMIPPNDEHVQKLIEFVDKWDRNDPLLIHCWAGISRSTAAAFIATCRLNPSMSENEIAEKLRQESPSASPNKLLVSIADKLLGRGGRMVKAIVRIGRGVDSYEGKPFELWFD